MDENFELFEKLGADVFEDASALVHEGLLLTVKVEVAFEPIESLKNLRFSWLTKRKNRVHVHDFGYDDSRKVVQFLISTGAHPSFLHSYGTVPVISTVPIATTFADYCFLSADGTSAETKLEVDTPMDPDSHLGDLTWVLPSKFADDLIEVMHVLNSTLLHGVLEHGIIYGPYLLERK